MSAQTCTGPCRPCDGRWLLGAVQACRPLCSREHRRLGPNAQTSAVTEHADPHRRGGGTAATAALAACVLRVVLLPRLTLANAARPTISRASTAQWSPLFYLVTGVNVQTLLEGWMWWVSEVAFFLSVFFFRHWKCERCLCFFYLD